MPERLRVRPAGDAGGWAYVPRLLQLLREDDRVELVAREAEVLLALDGRPRFARGARTVSLVRGLGHIFARAGYGPLEWVRENWRVASAARRSDHLLVPSAAVALGLERYLGVPASRVTAVAMPPALRRASREEVAELRARRRLPDRYVVVAGGRSAVRLPELGLPAVPEGAEGEAGRAALLSGALAWLNPSAYEGDPLAAYEAMACGCVPIVAATGALPHAVEAGGIALAPGEPDAWRRAVAELAGDGELRARLAAAGLKTAAELRAAGTAREALWAALRG